MTTTPPPPPGSDPTPGPDPFSGRPAPGAPSDRTSTPEVGTDEKTWSILAHLSAPAAFLLSLGTLSFLGPLIIWVVFKDRSPLVRTASAGAFNFNVTVWLVYVACWVVVLFTLGLGFIVAIPVWIVLFVVAAVLHVQAAMRASAGRAYHYPLQVPILR